MFIICQCFVVSVYLHVTKTTYWSMFENGTVQKHLTSIYLFTLFIQLCHCITVVTTCARVDAFSVLYLLLMLVFLFSPRRVCARLWPSYMVILAALIPIQYASCIGLPPGLCLSKFSFLHLFSVLKIFLLSFILSM